MTGTRNWCLAIAAAVLVHVVVLKLVYSPVPVDAGKAGSQGMTVVLGTARGGPEPASAFAFGRSSVPTVRPAEIAEQPKSDSLVAKVPAAEVAMRDRTAGIPRATPVEPVPTAVSRNPPETGVVPSAGEMARPTANTVAAMLPAAEAVVRDGTAGIQRATPVGTVPAAVSTNPSETMLVPPVATSSPSAEETVAADPSQTGTAPLSPSIPAAKTESVRAGTNAVLRDPSVANTVPPIPALRTEPPEDVAARAPGEEASGPAPAAPDGEVQAVFTPVKSAVPPANQRRARLLPPDTVPAVRPVEQAVDAPLELTGTVRGSRTGETVVRRAARPDDRSRALDTAAARTVPRLSAPVDAGTPARGAATDGAGERRAVLGQGASGVAGDYYATILAWLKRHKRYPQRSRLRGEEGRVLLRIGINREGGVTGFGIEQGSGHARLDKEARLMVERAEPLPRMPSGMQGDGVELLLPVEFVLR